MNSYKVGSKKFATLAEAIAYEQNGRKRYGFRNIEVVRSKLGQQLEGSVRCPDHRNGGATTCPRGGAALQIWQRKQWGD